MRNNMNNAYQENCEAPLTTTKPPYPWGKVLLGFAGLLVVCFIAVTPPASISGDAAIAYKMLFGGAQALLFGFIYAVYKYFRR